MVSFPCLLAAVLVSPALCYESFFGRCPSSPDMANFEMEKFEGLWYVVESFNSYQKCVTWNISKGATPGVWNLKETKESGALHVLGLKPSLAEITQPDPNHPGKLRIHWPLSLAGSTAFTMYNTDYENIAGVFECQNVGLFHRQNGVVLSRTPNPTVDRRQMARVRTNDIKVEYYQVVSQFGCKIRPSDGTQGADLGPLDGSGAPIRGELPDFNASTIPELA